MNFPLQANKFFSHLISYMINLFIIFCFTNQIMFNVIKTIILLHWTVHCTLKKAQPKRLCFALSADGSLEWMQQSSCGLGCANISFFVCYHYTTQIHIICLWVQWSISIIKLRNRSTIKVQIPQNCIKLQHFCAILGELYDFHTAI